MGLTILEVVLGAIIAILITIRVEKLRKPELELRIAPPKDIEYQDRPATVARFTGLELVNKPLPRWARRWMSREAAMQCHGTITFYHLDDGQNVFGRVMRIRWADAILSPEPIPIRGFVDSVQITIIDPTRFTLESRIDVHPGEDERQRLDVAARFDNEDECYGWNNESYLSDPPWRNPNWKLSKGRYLVRVTVLSAGEKCTGIFRLVNDVAQQDFRIEPVLSTDSIRIQETVKRDRQSVQKRQPSTRTYVSTTIDSSRQTTTLPYEREKNNGK
jgi:hypothetical protein